MRLLLGCVEAKAGHGLDGAMRDHTSKDIALFESFSVINERCAS